ncbi:MAG: ABC transporter ATP-binding protein [Thermodesulfobacteriota bacterium]
MTGPVLKINNLKTYFNTPRGIAKPVDGISLEIEKGETFALVGESGCGKSVTALSTIQLVPEPAGFIAGGEIILNGRNIIGLPEREKRAIRGDEVSMIFQEPMTSLNPVFTVGNQISESIRLHQMKNKAEAKALSIEMLAKVGLPEPEKLYDEYPHRLSGGMMQRVMIAIALACKPDLLIADEPTTALDVTIQAQILELTQDLQAELGTAILLITHNMALVYRNAKHVGVMYAGKIVETATTAELFRSPMHPYTIQLLKAIPGRERRGEELQTIKGTVPAATDFPAGCRFSGRCPREMSGCASIEPRDIENTDGHIVSCHLYCEEFMNGSDTKLVSTEASGMAPLTTRTKEEPLSTPLIKVTGLKKHYPIRKGLLKKTVGFVKAVDGIELSIDRGRTLALVGESGCGKTTAGKSIIQLLKPTDGSVLFKDKEITKLSAAELKPAKGEMQIIFQDPYSSLNPRMIVSDIIEEGISSLKPGLSKSERKEKIAMALTRVGLTPEMALRYPHEFSGGQRQRIGIARVLAVEPEFIVCDEAVSALDVSVQAQILNLLKSIQKDFGITYLFITHDLGVVEYIADDVAVMYDGRIVETGTVDEIFTNPKNDYTKKLLSAVPRIEENKTKKG